MTGSRINPEPKQTNVDKKVDKRVLLLYNDDVNTFDFVIKSLVEVCNHNNEQAEQCAYITHYKGKCDIKTGSMELLKPMKNILIDRGLSVTIE
ncbi:MAG TPA: ATP-dependent Clp protease adaptor ClpS [Salinivirga sp.]|uniref:ATP-dependent Clp protease adaptor n=1 Tax=Salinivirga cyanobacteriivorans TaxID=1307839 RepID=A0A0S2HWV5_9BACT|nr:MULTISPECIES: ATP-dependent Clp protease adaptor ClpS [Salinivirga]ALO14348.1 ATP-dependent Clp protease adaptor [Salinivirga cyanobacteriivorans]HKK58975.1 ATP-dependent Clp protease adaptor ClpS [Salinivirga sp.]